MLKINCDRCDLELEAPGALIFSPPLMAKENVGKYHLCVSCWKTVREVIWSKHPSIPCSTCGKAMPQTGVPAAKAWCSDECYERRSKT